MISIGPVIIVTTKVIFMPTSFVIICLATHTMRTLGWFHWLSDILTSQTPRYLAPVSA